MVHSHRSLHSAAPFVVASPQGCEAHHLSLSSPEGFMATLPQDPVPLRPVNIFVPREVAFDLKKMNRITAEVLGRLGCEGCHSGRILYYHTLQDFVVNPKTLEVQEFSAGMLGG
jgi:hypothetical protein